MIPFWVCPVFCLGVPIYCKNQELHSSLWVLRARLYAPTVAYVLRAASLSQLSNKAPVTCRGLRCIVLSQSGIYRYTYIHIHGHKSMYIYHIYTHKNTVYIYIYKTTSCCTHIYTYVYTSMYMYICILYVYVYEYCTSLPLSRPEAVIGFEPAAYHTAKFPNQLP